MFTDALVEQVQRDRIERLRRAGRRRSRPLPARRAATTRSREVLLPAERTITLDREQVGAGR